MLYSFAKLSFQICNFCGGHVLAGHYCITVFEFQVCLMHIWHCNAGNCGIWGKGGVGRKWGSVAKARLAENVGSVKNAGLVENVGRWKTRGRWKMRDPWKMRDLWKIIQNSLGAIRKVRLNRAFNAFIA